MNIFHYFFIFMVSTLISISSCKRCRKKDQLSTFGDLTCSINGKSFHAKIYLLKINDDSTINLTVQQQFNPCEEQLPKSDMRFYKIPQFPSKATLFNNNNDSTKLSSAMFSTSASYDVGCDLFRIVENDGFEDFIKITEIKGELDELKAEFQMNMKFYQLKCGTAGFADSINITNGKIHYKRNK